MADINFIVLKINGIDISEMSHCDAVQMFLKASEPITLEVRRPKTNDLKNYITNAFIPPMTPLISSSSSYPSLRTTLSASSSPSLTKKQQQLCAPETITSTITSSCSSSPSNSCIEKDPLAVVTVPKSPVQGGGGGGGGSSASSSLGRKCYVSTGIQTDTVITEYIFSDASIDDQSNENIFDEGLPPEIDIEEVTLKKSTSNEKLGLTVSYSSGSDDTDTCTEVYISDIIPNSVAARDGRLRQGDQILQVNGRDVSTKEDTETLIAENKNAVTFLVSRYLYVDDDLRTSFDEYDRDFDQQTYQNYQSSSVATKQQQQHNEFLPVIATTTGGGDARYSSEQTTTNSNTSRSSSSHKSLNADKPPSVSISSKDMTKSKLLFDSINNLNIEAHLESVNQELAQLTSRMENSMMLHGVTSSVSSTKQDKDEKIRQIQQSNASHIYRAPVDSVHIPSTATTCCLNPTVDLISSTPKKITTIASASKSSTIRCGTRQIESDTEHIYETIPEDLESEPFYCLPYESIEKNLVEQWLEMQHCQQELLLNRQLQQQQQQQQLQQQQQQQQINVVETPTKGSGGGGGACASRITNSKKDRGSLLLQQIKAIASNNKFQQHHHHQQQQQILLKTTTKSNSSGEDHENSSSAYNTGGSCNSNPHLIAAELNSNDDGAGGQQRINIPSTSHNITVPAQFSTTTTTTDHHCIDIYNQDINDNCEECQRLKKDNKTNSPKHEQQKSPQKSMLLSQRLNSLRFPYFPALITSTSSQQQQQQQQQQQRAPDPPQIVDISPPEIPSDTMYTNMANLKRTMLLQQKLFRQTLIRQNIALAQASQIAAAGAGGSGGGGGVGNKISPATTTANDRLHFTAPNLSQYHFVSSQEVSAIQSKPIACEESSMVWKVKRRQDGTRYIVRRPVRNRILRERAIRLTTERNNDQTTEDDTISEIKTGRYWTREERKKHIERAKERRLRQQMISSGVNYRCDQSENIIPSSGIVLPSSLANSSNVANKKQQQQGRLPCGQQPTLVSGSGGGGGGGGGVGTVVVISNNLTTAPTSTAIAGALIRTTTTPGGGGGGGGGGLLSTGQQLTSSLTTPHTLITLQQQQQQQQQPNEYPTIHKKSVKRKKKDDANTSSNVVADTNNKMVGLLSVTTV